MKTYKDINSAATMDAIVCYAETLLDVHFTHVKKNRYNALCPFHADTKESFKVYVTKDNDVRFHCFGTCRGDWDIYDLIMLRMKNRFSTAQEILAEHLGIKDFISSDDRSPYVPDPNETPVPDDSVRFVEPKKHDENSVGALNDAANFYNDLLLSNKDQYKHIWDYLFLRGIEIETIRKFKIGYAPPYSDDQFKGRALITGFSQRFKKDYGVFNTFSDIGLVRCLNDVTAKKYGYYCRQIDFTHKDPFLRNYGDYFAGQIVFPIYDAEKRPTGFVGRTLDNRGIRWFKEQNREISLFTRTWLYGIEQAERYIRQYRTIILVGGIFDYFAFYNLLQEQDKPVVVSTLGSYLTPDAMNMIKGLDIKHFIVAYNWDELARNGIERIAVKLGGWVYYLGGPAEGQKPYELLKPLVDTIDGFSLKQPKTDSK